MTRLLEDRTISMILTVPHLKELSRSVESLDSLPKISQPPSIPIYHGSIIQIEQNHDDENTSDLIVRVPNFHHISNPSVTISTNQMNEIEGQQQSRLKRRAPICPIQNGSQQNENPSHDYENSHIDQSEIKLPNSKRLVIGLRNLSRTIKTNCKSKRSTNINQITIIPVLPDVEVITENLQTTSIEKKNNKNQNSTSKFLTPKILCIKRKHFKIRKKQPSTNSIDSQTNTDDKTYENSRVNIKENENQSIHLDHQVEPPSIINIQSIPTLPSDSQINQTEDIPSTEFVHVSNQNIDIHSVDQENIDQAVYVVHPNDDTYSECYEITYELDPDFRYHKEPVYLTQTEDTTDPFAYQDLASATSGWVTVVPSNNYEQIDQSQLETSLDQFEKEPRITRVTFQSVDDTPPTTHNQSSIYQSESIPEYSSLQDDGHIAPFDDTAIINEDYKVLLQFLKRVLQLESNSDEQEFNQELQQFFPIENLNQTE